VLVGSAPSDQERVAHATKKGARDGLAAERMLLDEGALTPEQLSTPSRALQARSPRPRVFKVKLGAVSTCFRRRRQAILGGPVAYVGRAHRDGRDVRPRERSWRSNDIALMTAHGRQARVALRTTCGVISRMNRFGGRPFKEAVDEDDEALRSRSSTCAIGRDRDG